MGAGNLHSNNSSGGGSEKRGYISTSTSSLSASTTIAAGKGMYVTCSSRGILDQGNIVRGTYFPPLATSQDHQNLGTVTQSQSISGGGCAGLMVGLNYTSNHHMNVLQDRDNGASNNNNGGSNNNNTNATNHNLLEKDDLLGGGGGGGGGGDSHPSVSSHNGLCLDGYGGASSNYETITVSAPMPTYASSSFVPQYKDYVSYHHQNQSSIAHNMQQTHSQQHMIDDVDSREFEKYFKYTDPNHNFNDFDSSSYHHGHHTNEPIYQHNNPLANNASVPHILSSPHHHPGLVHQDYYHLYHYHPNSPISTSLSSVNSMPAAGNALTKVDTMTGSPVAGTIPTNPSMTAAVLGSTDIYVQPENLKEDDFSNILAGVRKTCYSN